MGVVDKSVFGAFLAVTNSILGEVWLSDCSAPGRTLHYLSPALLGKLHCPGSRIRDNVVSPPLCLLRCPADLLPGFALRSTTKPQLSIKHKIFATNDTSITVRKQEDRVPEMGGKNGKFVLGKFPGRKMCRWDLCKNLCKNVYNWCQICGNNWL
ncbi:hypothetical protein Fcan01_24591 [Folsomia candida]|uniref:Uncharacterized protein n=1 Tax=Folsomia candida TaxID=158441 RepID=A0A226D780_FOLCA|nr:hypothetical protein Fcan01_24591 [Folsomia candida]